MELSKGEKLYCLIIDTHGNPSIDQIIDCGFSEDMAVEGMLRMASAPAWSLVNGAVRMLRSMGIVTYMGRPVEDYLTTAEEYEKHDFLLYDVDSHNDYLGAFHCTRADAAQWAQEYVREVNRLRTAIGGKHVKNVRVAQSYDA